MVKIFLTSLVLLVVVVIFIKCKNKNKNDQHIELNKETVQPFVEYPFDKSLLSHRIRLAIKDYQPYETTTKIEKIIDDESITDANNKLCHAYYVWMDLMMTDEYNTEALVLLDKILEKDPKHTSTLKLKAHIENELKELQVKANQSAREFYSIPFEKLTLQQAEDFAYYLGQYKSDKESYELQYKLWTKLYNEHPDTKYETINGERQLYYGYKYYNLARVATVLWDNLGRHEEARPLFWKIIEWENTKDVLLYRFLEGVIFRLIDETIVKNDITEFIRLLKLMQAKFEILNQSPLKLEKLIPIVPNALETSLIEYGLEVKDKESLKYIVQILLEQEKPLDKKTKENIEKAKVFLNK